jgi:hypothetical protein
MLRQSDIVCRRSRDYDLVRRTAVSLWSEMADPALPAPVPIADDVLDRFTFIEVLKDGKHGGFFVLNGTEFHAMLLPCVRGRSALRAANAAFAWIRANLGDVSLVAYHRHGRPNVAWYARSIGFKRTGSDAEFVHYTKETV